MNSDEEIFEIEREQLEQNQKFQEIRRQREYDLQQVEMMQSDDINIQKKFFQREQDKRRREQSSRRNKFLQLDRLQSEAFGKQENYIMESLRMEELERQQRERERLRREALMKKEEQELERLKFLQRKKEEEEERQRQRINNWDETEQSQRRNKNTFARWLNQPVEAEILTKQYETNRYVYGLH